MSPIYVPGKVVFAQQQKYPAVLGEPWGGGFFAGYISHTADGNPTHALIVAPRADGMTTSGGQWKTSQTLTAGTTSDFDGAVNTADIVTAGIADHPAAEFCVNLSIGGFTDWYLPARYELEIAYFNLKPTNTANSTSAGSNVYSVPRRDSNYTLTYPAQTALTAFNTSTEAFTAFTFWSSTQISATFVWDQNFDTGNTTQGSKTTANRRVRAFRRIAL
jgi:hypothetical protein